MLGLMGTAKLECEAPELLVSSDSRGLYSSFVSPRGEASSPGASAAGSGSW